MWENIPVWRTIELLPWSCVLVLKWMCELSVVCVCILWLMNIPSTDLCSFLTPRPLRKWWKHTSFQEIHSPSKGQAQFVNTIAVSTFCVLQTCSPKGAPQILNECGIMTWFWWAVISRNSSMRLLRGPLQMNSIFNPFILLLWLLCFMYSKVCLHCESIATKADLRLTA